MKFLTKFRYKQAKFHLCQKNDENMKNHVSKRSFLFLVHNFNMHFRAQITKLQLQKNMKKYEWKDFFPHTEIILLTYLKSVKNEIPATSYI